MRNTIERVSPHGRLPHLLIPSFQMSHQTNPSTTTYMHLHVLMTGMVCPRLYWLQDLTDVFSRP